MTSPAAPMKLEMPQAGSLVVFAIIAVAQALVAGFQGISSHLPWLAAATLLLLIALLPVLLRGQVGRWPVGIAFLLLLWLGVGLATSSSREISLPFTWIWIYAIAAGLLVLSVARSRGPAVVLLALCIPSALGAVSVAWEHGVLGLPPTRVRDPNVSADAAVVMLLVGVAVLAAGESRPGVAGSGGRGVSWPVRIAALLLTFATGLVIAPLLSARAVMVLAPVALLLICWPLRRPFWRLLPLWLVATYLFPASRMPGVVRPAASFAPASFEVQLEGRLQSIGAALEFFGTSPITGTGLMTFSFLFPPVRDASVLTTGGYMVHNDWIQLLQELGIPFFLALAAFAGVLVVAWWVLRKRLQRHPSDYRTQIGHAAVIAAGLVLVHALVNFPLYDPALLASVIACGCVGLLAAFPAWFRSGDDCSETRRGRLLFAGGAVLVFALLVQQWTRLAAFAVGTVVLGSGVPFPGVEPRGYPAATQFAIAEQLQVWAPAFSGAPYAQARAADGLFDAALPARREDLAAFATASYEQAIAMNPYLPQYYVDLASFLERSGRAELGVRLGVLRAGLERDPLAPPLWLELAGQLERAGERGRLVAVLLGEWLPTCAYAALRAPFMANRLVDRLPSQLPPDRVASVEACRAEIEGRLARLAVPEPVTTPAPPR